MNVPLMFLKEEYRMIYKENRTFIDLAELSLHSTIILLIQFTKNYPEIKHIYSNNIIVFQDFYFLNNKALIIWLTIFGFSFSLRIE